MIRTIKVELNAAFPQMPLIPFQVYHNSAAAITVLNVPRRIVSLSLTVKNVSGVDQTFAAQRQGSAWISVIPGDFLAQSGTSTKGVKIVGVDEQANSFTLGAADLVVLLDDGTVTPVSSGGDMKHSEFSDLEAPENMTQKESNALLARIVSKLKGPALLLLSACCLPAFAALSPDTDFGDISPTNKLGEVVRSVVDGAARPLPRYLHIYDAADSYPDAAAEYYAYRQGGGAVPAPQCSAVRDGNTLSRNFDFPFDERAEFVVRMSAGIQAPSTKHPAPTHRFASVGVAQVGTNLTEAIVTSGKPEYSHLYKWLPGATVDGINERGVVAEINVVDGPPQWRSGIPSASQIHPLAAVRWALDNGTSAHMVATNLAARIAFPSGWAQNFHYMIADETATYIVENGTNYLVTGRAVMTNFRLYPTHSTGEGQERYDILLSSACCITNAWYTRAYHRETNPPWVSDLADVIDYTNDIFNAWASHPKEYFRTTTTNYQLPTTNYQLPTTNYTWWQTVHTSIYDITNRVLRVAVQETDDFYTFAVPAAGTDEAAVRKIAESVVSPVASSVSRLESSKADKSEYGYVEYDGSHNLTLDESTGFNLYGWSNIYGSMYFHGGFYIDGWWATAYFTDESVIANDDSYRPGTYYFPWSWTYDHESTPSSNKLALVSHIEAATNGLVSAENPAFADAVKSVMEIRDEPHNLKFTITADDGRFYFTPVGAIDPEE